MKLKDFIDARLQYMDRVQVLTVGNSHLYDGLVGMIPYYLAVECEFFGATMTQDKTVIHVIYNI